MSGRIRYVVAIAVAMLAASTTAPALADATDPGPPPIVRVVEADRAVWCDVVEWRTATETTGWDLQPDGTWLEGESEFEFNAWQSRPATPADWADAGITDMCSDDPEPARKPLDEGPGGEPLDQAPAEDDTVELPRLCTTWNQPVAS